MKASRALVMALVVVLAAFSLTACGSPSPKEVVNSTLGAIQKGDVLTLITYFDSSSLEVDESQIIDDLLSGGSSDSTSSSIAQSEAARNAALVMLDKIKGLQYTVLDENIQGDTATVTVSLSTYDLATPMVGAATDLVKASLVSALGQALNVQSLSESELMDRFFTSYAANLKEETTLRDPVVVTFDLEKKNGRWLVVQPNDDTLDMLSGGLYKGIKSVVTVMQTLEENKKS